MFALFAIEVLRASAPCDGDRYCSRNESRSIADGPLQFHRSRLGATIRPTSHYKGTAGGAVAAARANRISMEEPGTD